MRDFSQTVDYEKDQLSYALANAIKERDEAIADRDIARLAAMDSDRAHDRMVAELEKVYKERDDALSQIVQAECRAERFCQERDEARDAAAKWESSSDAMERAGAEQARRADENREWALRAERERDEALKLFISSKRARASLSKACDSLQKELRETKRERDEAREALDRIARPVWWMQEDQKRKTGSINGICGGMALALSEDAEYLKGIAKSALNRGTK